MYIKGYFFSGWNVILSAIAEEKRARVKGVLEELLFSERNIDAIQYIVFLKCGNLDRTEHDAINWEEYKVCGHVVYTTYKQMFFSCRIWLVRVLMMMIASWMRKWILVLIWYVMFTVELSPSSSPEITSIILLTCRLTVQCL